MTAKIHISASLPPDLKAQIETLAKAKRRSVSAMMAMLLEEALIQRETEHKVLLYVTRTRIRLRSSISSRSPV